MGSQLENAEPTARTLDRWRAAKGFTQTSQSLAAYRILYALTLLIILGPGRIGPGVTSNEIGGVPADMYHPPLGPAMLLSGWPPATVVLAFELLLTASLGAILIGAYTRTASLTTAACGLVLTSLLYSEGKIDHAILWSVVIPAVMAFTSWGDTWSIDAGRQRIQQRKGFQSEAARPVALVALALGIVFASAAIVKALTGWLDPGTSSALGWAFAHGVQSGHAAVAPPLLSITPIAMWLTLDYVTVVFEAGFLVAALRRDWLIPYLFLAAFFHTSAAFAGFPPFIEIILVYLLFIRLDAVPRRLRRPLDAFGTLARERPTLVGGVTALMLALYCITALVLDGPVTIARISAAAIVPGIVLLFGLWPAFIVIGLVVRAKHVTPPEDRPNNTQPAWAMPAAAAFLAAEIAITLTISEPYPALTGPAFMGTFDDGHSINIAEQHFAIVNNGHRTSVKPTDVLDLSLSGAVQLGAVRFPAPYLDSAGHIIDQPSLQDRLANQYHHFSSRHLDYGGSLSDTEKTWIRRNLADHDIACDIDCSFEVDWRRLSFDRNSGKPLLEETVDRKTYPLD